MHALHDAGLQYKPRMPACLHLHAQVLAAEGASALLIGLGPTL